MNDDDLREELLVLAGADYQKLRQTLDKAGDMLREWPAGPRADEARELADSCDYVLELVEATA